MESNVFSLDELKITAKKDSVDESEIDKYAKLYNEIINNFLHIEVLMNNFQTICNLD